MSTIPNHPIAESIHSLLAVVGERRGRELPGPWFVAALEPLGIPAASVRQTLLRMTQRGELVARKVGRIKHYAFTDLFRGHITTGTAKIFTPAAEPWDGIWTIVHYRFPASGRSDRDQFKELLEIEGFGQLGNGLFIHPRDRSQQVRDGLAAMTTAPEVNVFRGESRAGETPTQLVQRAWDLDDIATAYDRFLARFAKASRQRPRPAEAFRRRLELALAYLTIAWSDPDLPPELLPPRWPGIAARKLTVTLYERWLPGALAHGDALFTAIDHDIPPTTRP
ncbi:MAG: hypothetical protein NXI31_12475 [bacterium]|nr:hypothetical protein [bacterium]